MGRRTFSELGVLGLYTESSLHCGAESGSGYVDLPIQRERHTQYPVVPGSTLKGVLRDELAAGNGRPGLSKDDIERFFGTQDASGPGRVTFGDGVLAAFPVRSSGAPFHWVTCPFVLERVLRQLGLKDSTPQGEPDQGTAWAAEGTGDGPVLLEELALTRTPRDDLFDPGRADSVVAALLDLLPPADRGFAHTREIFPKRLLIVRDDDFRELVEIGTEVVTRIKLNFLGTTTNLERKDYPESEHPEVTKEDLEGNLFVQELVPPEALFVAPLRALEDEGPAFAKTIGDLRVIRLGGDETVGRGITHTRWITPSSGNGKEG